MSDHLETQLHLLLKITQDNRCCSPILQALLQLARFPWTCFVGGHSGVGAGIFL